MHPLNGIHWKWTENPKVLPLSKAFSPEMSRTAQFCTTLSRKLQTAPSTYYLVLMMWEHDHGVSCQHTLNDSFLLKHSVYKLRGRRKSLLQFLLTMSEVSSELCSQATCVSPHLSGKSDLLYEVQLLQSFKKHSWQHSWAVHVQQLVFSF